MATVELAKGLAGECGFYVFPVSHGEDNSKKPLTPEGHLNATRDPGLIEDWWAKWPTAKVGVATGASGLVVADIDTKNGKDGFDSLDQAGLDIPYTYSYETGTGGSHFVYRAPEGVELNGQANYRKLEGVDRRGGSSWVMWVGDIPFQGEIEDAPEWLCDEVKAKKTYEFEGDLKEWFEGLTPGQPNALVRRAWERADKRFQENGNDFSHSDLVEVQFEAVRLGAEGNPGVPELLSHLEDLFMSRTGEHTRGEQDWAYEWSEALNGALTKYGDTIEALKQMPEYSIDMVPSEVPDGMITRPNGGKPEFSRLLGKLVELVSDDNVIASILWNCPATKGISREWGYSFVLHRIEQARQKPEPTRENPRVEEAREDVELGKPKPRKYELLTPEEREYIAKRPSFVTQVEHVATGMGYDQLPYFRSVAWVCAGMAFSFKGFIPMSKTHKMGTNLWFINLGGSGTGKSVTGAFRDAILDIIFGGDNDGGAPYDLGEDSSPQGLHVALLERDKMASLFSSDEAAGFFSTLGLGDWKTGIDEKITSWYNGYVQGSQKMTLKELRGKSALTSFNMHMFGTPDKVTRVVQAGMFETGFMARVNWVLGNPPRNDDSRFNLVVDDDEESHVWDEVPKEIQNLALDLMLARSRFDKPTAILPAPGVMERLSQAYKDMYKMAEGRENWDLIEPSITRLSETLMKCTAICAMYREDSQMKMEDALHAINAVEEWYRNLHRVTAMVSAGEFQRRCDELETYLRQEGGKATSNRIYHRFKGWIVRDSKEIENVLTYLIQSGIINRVDEGGLKYVLNGDI